MATIVQIDGVGKVELDDSFKSLSPAQQQSTVDEIANHHAAPSAAAAPPPKAAPDVKAFFADPKNRRDPLQDAAKLLYGAETGIAGLGGTIESMGRTGIRKVGDVLTNWANDNPDDIRAKAIKAAAPNFNISETTAAPTPEDVQSFAAQRLGFPAVPKGGDPYVTAGEFLPAVGPTAALIGKTPKLARALASMPIAKTTYETAAKIPKYFMQTGAAKDAAEALRVKALSSVENAANIGEGDVTAALNEAKAREATPFSTPALEARQSQYVLAQDEAAAAKANQEAAQKAAAALQDQESKRVITPVGTQATYETIGAKPQAEMLAAKAEREKDASQAWKDTSEEVDRIDASKQGFGTRIAYGQPFKDFIASVTKSANAPAGSPQTKAFYSKILDWFPADNINAIKPSQIMELKRFVAEEANAPAQGFKAIGKERADTIYKQLDNILETHLTDAETGVSPYAQRRDAYSMYKDAWNKDYASKYGKRFTATNVAGDAVSSGTDVARTLFSDPAAMRAAINDGASVPTLLESTASHIANEFKGKSIDAIAEMLQPGTKLSNTLKNVPEMAPLDQATGRYLQEITDQHLNGQRISSYNKVADDFAKAAAQSEKNAAVAQDRIAKGTETRKAQLSRQVQESMDTATARQQALMDVQQLRGDLSRVKDDPKEIIKFARSHFSENQDMLKEIDKIEKMNVSAKEMRSLVLKIVGGGVIGAVGGKIALGHL